MKKVFSGIQPSGSLHIGNYIGAIKQWVEMQNSAECLFCVVDLHAITVSQDPKALREKILEVTALYLACGIDPKKAKIFVQSENPNHTELTWILNCIAPMGQLYRMTQFKEKVKKQQLSGSALGEVDALINASAGLFDYPVLMAADILLYQTDEVPVGEDQKQHLELARDLAEKFNRQFEPVFKIPEPKIIRDAARIMSLQDPTKKMSKSDNNPSGTLNILDSEDQIRSKIMKAVTDSGSKVEIDMPIDEYNGVQNLLSIYAAFKNYNGMQHAWKENANKPYSVFKNDLFEIVRDELLNIQTKYREIRENDEALNRILDEGRDFAIERSSQTLAKVKNAVGLGR